MATVYELHPETPQAYQIAKIRQSLKDGAVILYPTDTVYAIGCDLHVKSAVERVRQIKQLSNDKPLTFLCPSLSNIAAYAYVSDAAYRLIVEAHRGLDAETSGAVQSAALLLLANHIGDAQVLKEALALAREAVTGGRTT